MSIVHFCDRCGDDITSKTGAITPSKRVDHITAPHKSAYIQVKSQFGDVIREVELCQKCLVDLYAFLQMSAADPPKGG